MGLDKAKVIAVLAGTITAIVRGDFDEEEDK